MLVPVTNHSNSPKALSLLLAAGTLAAGVAAATAGTAAAAPTSVTKTVVIGLDGTMLDYVKNANTPNLHRLIAEGTSGQSSILGHPTISGPSWSTILTGVWHTKHGVVDNSYSGARYDEYPTAFTRIEQAKPQMRTARSPRGAESPRSRTPAPRRPTSWCRRRMPAAVRRRTRRPLPRWPPRSPPTVRTSCSPSSIRWTARGTRRERPAPSTCRRSSASTPRSAGSSTPWTPAARRPARSGRCWSPPTTATSRTAGTAARVPRRQRRS